MSIDAAFDKINFTRNDYCCRRMFLGHVDVIDTLLQYSNNPAEHVSAKLSDSISESEIEVHRMYQSSSNLTCNLQEMLNMDPLEQDDQTAHEALNMNDYEYDNNEEFNDRENELDDDDDDDDPDDMDPDHPDFLEDDEQELDDDEPEENDDDND
jgi:hypothetical protein